VGHRCVAALTSRLAWRSPDQQAAGAHGRAGASLQAPEYERNGFAFHGMAEPEVEQVGIRAWGGLVILGLRTVHAAFEVADPLAAGVLGGAGGVTGGSQGSASTLAACTLAARWAARLLPASFPPASDERRRPPLGAGAGGAPSHRRLHQRVRVVAGGAHAPRHAPGLELGAQCAAVPGHLQGRLPPRLMRREKGDGGGVPPPPCVLHLVMRVSSCTSTKSAACPSLSQHRTARYSPTHPPLHQALARWFPVRVPCGQQCSSPSLFSQPHGCCIDCVDLPHFNLDPRWAVRIDDVFALRFPAVHLGLLSAVH